MTRARKPAPKSEASFQRQHSQFASRPFAPRAEKHEAPAGESCVNFSIADIDIFPRETVQPKLRLGPVGDRYEQEADRMARRAIETISSSDQGQVQRECGCKEKDDLDLEEDEKLRRKVAGFAPAVGGERIGLDLESSIKRARSGGQPLSNGVRQPMERAFGADFGSVRVHTDAQADRLNRSLQARAFTTGLDIFLRQGEYRPASSEGQRLLAHELTHVVQQKGGAVLRSTQIQSHLPQHFANETSLDLERDRESKAKGTRIVNCSVSLAKPNNKATLLPDNLKTGIKNLSGKSMDDEQLHHIALAPAQILASPYMQSNDGTVVAERFNEVSSNEIIQLQIIGKVIGTLGMAALGGAIGNVIPVIGTFIGIGAGGLIGFSCGYYYDSSAKKQISWQLYINPKDFAEAEKLDDPGMIYDNELSPGYKEGMVKAMQEELFGPNLGKKLDYKGYVALHNKVTSKLKEDRIKYSTTQESITTPSSVEAKTSYPIADWEGGEEITPAKDLYTEMIDNMPMVKDYYREKMPLAYDDELSENNKSVMVFCPEDKILFVRYNKEQGKKLVESILKRYYDEVRGAGNSDDKKLTAIVKAIRALHVTHPFKDANGRLHVNLMLNKFLKEQGFGLTVMPTEGLGVFGGGFTIDQLKEMVINGFESAKDL